jgi:hypothetical protein
MLVAALRSRSWTVPQSGQVQVRTFRGFGPSRWLHAAEVQETLAELAFVTGLDDIAAKLPASERLLGELVDELG